LTTKKRGYIFHIVMNVNVVVFNVSQDFRVGDTGDRRRERDEQFSRRSGDVSNSASNRAEQVIELVSRDGAWVGKGSTSTRRETPYLHAPGAKALHASAAVTTYDHEGKARYAPQDKGLSVNVTA
jgi:hypothetical protein